MEEPHSLRWLIHSIFAADGDSVFPRFAAKFCRSWLFNALEDTQLTSRKYKQPLFTSGMFICSSQRISKSQPEGQSCTKLSSFSWDFSVLQIFFKTVNKPEIIFIKQFGNMDPGAMPEGNFVLSHCHDHCFCVLVDILINIPYYRFQCIISFC